MANSLNAAAKNISCTASNTVIMFLVSVAVVENDYV